ncbi:GM23088 [Drosophila sechellia]|uniref:GM23088 n=1 Tax=Drosophila sechellia TaxID=7238 RepID=B4I6J0_DROSE|nr:GM23088 [Drosophila sechellia]
MSSVAKLLPGYWSPGVSETWSPRVLECSNLNPEPRNQKPESAGTGYLAVTGSQQSGLAGQRDLDYGERTADCGLRAEDSGSSP